MVANASNWNSHRMLIRRLLPSAVFLLTACSQSSPPPAEPSPPPESPTQQPADRAVVTPFQKEVERSKTVLSCKSTKITPGSSGWGALFGCIGGEAETVKFFINEEPETGRVSTTKFLWNDWFKDRGYGLHADAKDADKMIHDLVKLYPSDHDKALLKAFKGKKNFTVEGNGYRFEYTFDRGPAIDERMIVVTPLGSTP